MFAHLYACGIGDEEVLLNTTARKFEANLNLCCFCCLLLCVASAMHDGAWLIFLFQNAEKTTKMKEGRKISFYHLPPLLLLLLLLLLLVLLLLLLLLFLMVSHHDNPLAAHSRRGDV